MVYEEQPSEQLEKWLVVSLREARNIVIQQAKDIEQREADDRAEEARNYHNFFAPIDQMDRRDERMARLEQENAVLWRFVREAGYDCHAIEAMLGRGEG